MNSNNPSHYIMESMVNNEYEEDSKKGTNEGQAVKLFMNHIPSSMNEKSIQSVLSEYCSIEHVSVLRDKYTKKHKSTLSFD